MAEVIDVQCRDELYREIARAKENETRIALELEDLKKKFEQFKKTVITETDEAPTFGSDNIVTSGVVYNSLMSLNKRIDSLR